MPQSRDPDQYVHARQRLLPRRFRKKGDRDLQRQSVLYDHAQSRSVHSDGLPSQKDRNDPLKRNETPIKKPRHLRGFFNYWPGVLTSFSSRPFSLLELSSLALSDSPPILAFSLYQLLLTSFGQASCKTIFKSCHTKIQSKNTCCDEIRIETCR